MAKVKIEKINMPQIKSDSEKIKYLINHIKNLEENLEYILMNLSDENIKGGE